ncbi:M48 family metallopeptidase [Methylomonas sp. 2B]
MTAATEFHLRRSNRAKRTRIVVKPGRVEVVAPPKVPERQIQAFVAAQQDWIRAALRRVAEKTRPAPAWAPALYTDGAAVPYLGERIPLRIETAARKTVGVELRDGSGFHVRMPAGETSDESERIRLALGDWMKRQARIQALHWIERHAPRHGLMPRAVRIKTQKSRWGSCGPKNDINLNWLLMLAPPAALEYVVVHELCHIRHKNHSADFWQLVEAHLPNYREQRLWLKQHGAAIMQGL